MIIYEDGEMFNVPPKWLAEHDEKVIADAIEDEYNRIIGFLKWNRYAIVDNNGDYYSIEELEDMLNEQNNE